MSRVSARSEPTSTTAGRSGGVPAVDRWQDRVVHATPGVLRVGAGLLWLSNVGWKVPPDFGRGQDRCRGLCAFVAHGVEYGVVPPWRWLLEQVVSPNLGLFGWVTLAVEFVLAATLLSGRFTRTAALLGMGQSLAIGLSVANAPDEWYWSYALMVLLHLGVFATAARTVPGARRVRPALVAATVAAYGTLVAVANARNAVFASRGTRDWLLVGGDTDFPGDFGRNVLAGSVALGVLIAAAGLVGARLSGRDAARWLGGGLVAVAVLLLVAFDDTGNVLAARPAPLAVVAALGLWLLGTTRGARPAVGQGAATR